MIIPSKTLQFQSSGLGGYRAERKWGKWVKLEKEEEEDRISDLPDHIIHHILSFLPSTRTAIQTGILSKRWRNQWTHVPVLIFNFNSYGTYNENQINFVEKTLSLHNCSKIKKFHLYLNLLHLKKKRDHQIDSKIAFATTKDVEELDLNFSFNICYWLPQFLFNNASLIRLRTTYCNLRPNGKVNWRCLKVLDICAAKLAENVVQHILYGSPSLESLQLTSCSSELGKIVIHSESLKRLVLSDGRLAISVLEISCPKLEELCLQGMATKDPKLFAQAIERVLSGSSLLESMTIESIHCSVLDQLVIDSASLKRLVIQNITSGLDIKIISCPNLETLKLLQCLNVRDANFLNFPSSLCAALDFQPLEELKTRKSLVEEIMQQLQHVKELKFGNLFISILSNIKVGGEFSPRLNIKCLTVDSPHLKMHHLGIALLLHISPMLEKLVINVLPLPHEVNHKIQNNYWISNATVFACLVSHLKTIQIVGFGFRKGDVRQLHLLNIVQFLLKNARVLEKMMVALKNEYRTDISSEVSQELLSLPRCSQTVVTELLY